jgi:hypothetical protein
MQDRMQRWRAWMKDLETQGHLVSMGNPLGPTGAVVKDSKGSFSDGPYAETKDIVMGFSVVETKDLEQAIQLSKGCPILAAGGLVEVRPVLQM